MIAALLYVGRLAFCSFLLVAILLRVLVAFDMGRRNDQHTGMHLTFTALLAYLFLATLITFAR